MTTKHTKQKYMEKQTRLGAKAIAGAYEEIRSDSQVAKEKARPKLTKKTDESRLASQEESHLIQEFVPYRKQKKEQIHKKKKS